MSDGAIEFACPYCERITRVPASFGGKQGKCPGCQRVIEVPDPNAGAAGAPTVPTPPPTKAEPIGGPVAAGGVAGFSPGGMNQLLKADAAPGASDGAQRPCPYCGEKILSAAKKCKFCGEFLDPSARSAARAQGNALGDGVRLGGRGARLGARMIDGIIEFPFICAAVLGGLFLWMNLDPSMRGGGGPPPLGTAPSGALFGIGVVVILLIVAYQWYLISTTGQTIGKRVVGVKIVKLDGSDVDFVSGVILRNWIIAFLSNIPYGVGSCISLVNCLMIFGEEQRCLHDQIASTRVIEV